MTDTSPEERAPVDEQRGWRFHRWWNQFYKRRWAVLEQRKVDLEFTRIARKMRKESQ